MENRFKKSAFIGTLLLASITASSVIAAPIIGSIQTSKQKKGNKGAGNLRTLAMPGKQTIPAKRKTTTTKNDGTRTKSKKTNTGNNDIEKSKPVAKFKINQSTIVAGETRVTFTNQSKHPQGSHIVGECWDGQKEIYDEPGIYTITLRVLDEHGIWSEPYTQTIEVQKPHSPPVANFSTDKTTYKMGEPIHYEDLSTDAEDPAPRRDWINKKLGFFEPGEQTITLKVTNKFGLTAEVSQTITIIDEMLYSADEFNRLFTPLGEVYLIDKESMLNTMLLKPIITEEPRILYNSNNPEYVERDGILYQDRSTGKVCIMAHHYNRTGRDVKYYILARNLSDNPVTVTMPRQSIGGPNQYEEFAGRKANIHYLASFLNENDALKTIVPPNEIKIITPELSKKVIAPKNTISFYAEPDASDMVEYFVVVLDAKKDIYEELPNLQLLEKNKHVRGTFSNTNLILNVDEAIGSTPLYFVLGERDTYVEGTDMTTGEEHENIGNYGVLYKMFLKVKPYTLLSFIALGGRYGGGMLVNGRMVHIPTSGVLENPNQAAVIHRTGAHEETVEIVYSPSPGSSLPIIFLFTPLPPRR